MNSGIACVLLLLSAAQEPAGRWTFDPGTPHGKTGGRVAFLPSPVGAGGELLWLNGVDAFVEIDVPRPAELTLALWILPLELRAAGVAAGLTLSSDGTLKIGALQARLSAGQWTHLALHVAGGKGALHVNGEPAASGELRVEELEFPLLLGRSAKGAFFSGFIDDVRLYPRVLAAPEISRLVHEGLPWISARPRKPFPGRFELVEDDVVVFTGGEDALAAQEHGHLETLISLHAPRARALFRNMAWEGDTVHEQWRILNFGPWERQFERHGATVIFAQFGQVESLQGPGGIEGFAAAYGKLLDRFTARTPRIVLVSPTPFEKSSPPLPDLSARNRDLAAYTESIRRIADSRKLLFVDLFSKLRPTTRDGMHLDAAGHEAAAREIARQLGIAPGEILEPVRQAILAKNRPWADHWRPTNWAFLAGDRVDQPSSRDHRDRRVRWFPAEVQTFLALVRREEAKIASLLQAVAK